MNTYEFLSDLKNQDIKVWSEGERLRIDAPKGSLTAELQSALAERKADILQFFSEAQVEQTKADTWASLTAIQPNGSKPPLFMVPALATSALSLVPLNKHISPEQPLYGFNPIGLDGRETPHATIEEMAAFYVEEMCRHKPEGPYLIGGICYGGTIALEMGQQLLAAGKQVSKLVLLGVGAPAAGPSWTFRQVIADHRVRKVIDLVRDGKVLDEMKRLRRRNQKIKARLQNPETNPYQIVTNAQNSAHERYVAKHFHAPTILLLSEDYILETKTFERWQELVPNDLAYEVVAGSTHADLFSEQSNLQFVSQWLNDHI